MRPWRPSQSAFSILLHSFITAFTGRTIFPFQAPWRHAGFVQSGHRFSVQVRGDSAMHLGHACTFSSCRRIPIKPSHRWAAAIAYKHKGTTLISQHYACPFGATSSVYHWEKLGAFISAAIRKLLKIAVFRYVDDMFAPER